MDKLEVGQYVRTKKGIFQIRNKDFFIENKKQYLGVNGRYTCIDIETIEKASHNIIDLIEVGDYVNGFRVEEIGEYHSIKTDEVEIYAKVNCSVLLNCFYEEDIKSIVTKEQFESMSYKIEV